jgi:hypothetical protein
MKFSTDQGEHFDVDLKTRKVVVTKRGSTAGFEYDKLSGIYTGSTEGKFKQLHGDAKVEGEIISVAGAPEEFITTDDTTNVLFWTRNSVYEIDQEQKLFRRAVGLNDPVDYGDWLPYNLLFLELGHCAHIEYLQGNEPMNLRTSRVRKIHGTLVGQPPAEPTLLENSLNSVMAASPELE